MTSANASPDWSNGGSIAVPQSMALEIIPHLSQPGPIVYRSIHTTVDPTGGVFAISFAQGLGEKAMWLIDAMTLTWNVRFCRTPITQHIDSYSPIPETCDDPHDVAGFSGPFTFRVEINYLDGHLYTSLSFTNDAQTSGYTTSIAGLYFADPLFQLHFARIPQTLRYIAVKENESKERIFCDDCSQYARLSGTPGVIFDEKLFISEFNHEGLVELVGESDMDLNDCYVYLWIESGGVTAIAQTISLSGFVPNTPAGAGFIVVRVDTGIINSYPNCAISVESHSGGRSVWDFEAIRGSVTIIFPEPYTYGARQTGYDHSNPTEGMSMQLAGAGNSWIDFQWVEEVSSFYQKNEGQTIEFK